ncbi:Heparanase-like protein 1 [Morella rubra]|uniref:Heparanase-like protein 1 n=1 Tax=Morella rubra TaxID=262757 RepID=A0A6A1VV27_9ROSI|nr:Heparanase-like protein 1 [Morella rubra]
MASYFASFLILVSLPAIFAQEIIHAKIGVNGTTSVAEIDDYFICATLDWWPQTKCNYNQCPWGNASVINLDLSHPLLAKAIQAFKHLRIRIGGSLQDRVVYNVGNLKSPCHPFRKMKDGLFGFSKGCLYMRRWDELNHFFSKTGAIVTFGLNALYGRHLIKRGVWGGDWDSSNTEDLMKYTISKGYQIDSWEFGNELSGSGIGASVGAEQYGKDLIKLKETVNELYKKSASKPSLIAPGGFFDQEWYTKLLQVSGPRVVNVVTHHIYNLGAGVDPSLVSKILDPSHLSKISDTFSNVRHIIQKHGPWASAWVGESGGAYNSGGHHVSDTFVNSFWYLDQLGMASKYNTTVYCRQSLIGGNYGLLNTTTFVPRPDYFSALLWHRLMGKRVLAVDTDASPYLRSYAHCSKGRPGITLLLINLSNQTDFIISVENLMNMNLHANGRKTQRENSFVHSLKKTVSWVGRKASDGPSYREEYHLTPKDGYLRSGIAVLNGIPLKLTDEEEIPTMHPVFNDLNSPLTISPLSIAFVVLPNFDAPACV